MNLLCDGEIPFTGIEQLNRVRCKKCGYRMMLDWHVLKTKEALKQIESWKNKILYRDAFKKMDFNKLPTNMSIQTMT